MSGPSTQSRERPRAWLAGLGAAAILSAVFLLVVAPMLETLFWDYDEGSIILATRFIRRGLAPFADFIHHQPPLHLYLLAIYDRFFGPEIGTYRLLSASSVAASSLLIFLLTRPFVGALPALVAQAVFLFTPAQIYPLCVLPETPTVVFILLGAGLLFVGNSPATTYAAGAAFVLALLVKPTSGVAVVAAVASLVFARDWPRLGRLAVSGVAASLGALAWLLWISDGAFAEVLRVQFDRAYTRSAGMWSVPSGFADMTRQAGAETRWQWAVHCFAEFFRFPDQLLPMGLFVVSLAGIPIWTQRLAKGDPALRAFAVLWPLSYCALNFFLIDFVAAEKFTPFLAFSAFWLAAVVWAVSRRVPAQAAVAAGVGATLALAAHYAWLIRDEQDPAYYAHVRRLAREHPSLLSFTPMLFAVSEQEPGCGFWNPINTYGRFGVAVGTEKTRSLRFTDESLIDCLRKNPDMRVLLDWGFYFYVTPDAPLREYLRGEGRDRREFFSREARAQWDQAVFSMPTDK